MVAHVLNMMKSFVGLLRNMSLDILKDLNFASTSRRDKKNIEILFQNGCSTTINHEPGDRQEGKNLLLKFRD